MGSSDTRKFSRIRKLAFFSGPGFESNSEKDNFLIRFGIAYEIIFNERWSASPEILVDFIEGGAKTYLLGIAVGYGF